jgi:hypothetical protein
VFVTASNPLNASFARLLTFSRKRRWWTCHPLALDFPVRYAVAGLARRVKKPAPHGTKSVCHPRLYCPKILYWQISAEIPAAP